MLAIKFKRIGKKRQASFRVVVAEKRLKLQGRFIEDLGWVNPRTDEYRVDAARAAHWIKMGAKPTDTAWNLLVRAGTVRGKKISVHGKSKKPTEVVPALAAMAPAPAPETPEVPKETTPEVIN